MKRWGITCILLLLFILNTNSLYAQTSTPDSIARFFQIINRVPQEKLYLHLDKPFYGAGEKIWFKAYLRNAITHKNDTISNLFVVELINRKDSIIQRQKIIRDSLGFTGSFSLPAELPQGDYYLRGYSNWMLNEDADFFYSRNIKIGNSIDLDIISTIEYLKEDDENFVAKIKFTNQENVPFTDTKIKYSLWEKGKVQRRGNATTNSEGIIRINLPDLNQKEEQFILDVAFHNSEYKYQRSFFTPHLLQDFHVDFFPEGGNLLAGVGQNITFKALGSNGLSKDVTGTIFNSDGETITELHCEHDGMGKFSFTPDANQSYTAVITSADGISKEFKLPEVKAQGVTIALVKYKNSIRYQILKTSTTTLPERLYLIAHTRGLPIFIQLINDNSLNGRVETNLFKEGINHLLLVDENGIPLSQRLFFIRHENQAEWQVSPDKEQYARREKVTLTLQAKNKHGLPLNGEFSVSITDATSVKVDSLADNILSNMLLTSDLKGYIENPGYYFLHNDKRTDWHLDLVMLTHGWTRFDMSQLTHLPQINNTHFVERGQSISGRIKGLFGGKVKEGPIIALAPSQRIFQTIQTDRNGEFIIDDIRFPDETTFIVQARTKRGFNTVDILLDEQIFPPTGNKRIYSPDPVRFMDDYLVNTREQYFHEGGMRVINLREVVVQAEKRKVFSNGPYGGTYDHSINSEMLEKMHGQSIYDIISRFAGVQVINEEIRIRNSHTPPAIVVDGIVYEQDILSTFNVDDIAHIDIAKGASASILGSRGGSGAIFIELKTGAEVNMNRVPKPGITTITPLGYSVPAQFYHPKYETPDEYKNPKADIRTTLYWNPSLQFDAEGNAVIEYYTSDNSTEQIIEIEGIDENGEVCRYGGRVR